MLSPKFQVLPVALVAAVAVSLTSAGPLAWFVDFPPAKSAAAVRELIPLLDAHKIDTFGAKDPDGEHYVAVKYVAGLQMFAVSAATDRPGDVAYFLEHKDFASVYDSLRSSTASKDRFIVDDAECNGLVPQPKRSQPNDDAIFDVTRKTFDGIFTDPRHPDPKKPVFDEYLKTFTDADDRYTHILTLLIGELKKG
jgi:hypothetical protein